MSKRVVLLLADGFEEIEALSVADILRRAEVEVILCSVNGETVKGSHGIKVIADKRLSDFNEEVDGIILPGGMPGSVNLANSEKVKELIHKAYNTNKLIAAICAAPAVVLAPLGILAGKKATAYPGLEKDFDKKTTFVDEKVVVDGNIITSRGPGTALLFSLTIVENLVGKGISEELRSKVLATG